MKRVLLPCLAVLAPWGPAFGQVGHHPAGSPYRDIPRGGGLVVAVGYLSGGQGSLDVGITNAMTGGVRYDLQIGGPFRLLFGLHYGAGERYLIDPTADSASRKSGPVDDSFLLVDSELQFALTGQKTWRGFAPYVSGALGMAMGGAEPAADTSRYEFGTKFLLIPGAGVRWYPARRFSMQADLRLVFWRLRYPSQYYVPGSDGTAVLDISDKDNEWTRHPWLRVGVGWTF